MSGVRISSYAWAGGREPMLCFGEGEPQVALALPLFEEANRTRAFGVSILRALAELGIAGALPDLPSQGESMVPTCKATLANMRAAFGTIRARAAIGIRSGALLLDARPAWALSPQSGPELLRELARIKGARLAGDPVEVAGNHLSPALLAELETASPPPTRTVRLASDRQSADLHLDGAPLWRRAEPGNDVVLVGLLAADIAHWIATCAA